MDRVYAQEVTSKVNFFIGKEIEKTKFEGLDTLFIVGNQDLKDIKAKIEVAANIHDTEVKHLYFAANHTYDIFNNFKQLRLFINSGYKVTYETTNDRINQELIDKLPINDSNFLLMISVVVSPLAQLLHNSVIKIDDTDTNRKNPGVYCTPLRDLVNRKNTTFWDEYGHDTVL